MIQAVIFDMDGVLIDSEPFWHQAEKRALASVGLHLTPEMSKATFGLRTREMLEMWHSRFGWNGKSVDELEAEINEEVTQLILNHGVAMPGVFDVLRFFNEVRLPVGLATSSPYPLIDAVFQRLDIAPFFTAVHSADDEHFGKPNPAVYLSVAGKLGLSPWQCLVFEDSFVGVVAGLAARMSVVAVPHPMDFDDPRFGAATFKIPSLAAFSPSFWDAISRK